MINLDSQMGKIEWNRLLKNLSPYTIRKGLLYLKHYGPKEFWIRIHERFEPEEIPYEIWYPAYKPDTRTLDNQRRKKFKNAPLISIAVPAYRTRPKFLAQMIESMRSQTYKNWELCIANGSPDDAGMAQVLDSYHTKDRRIKVKNLSGNLGIAGITNAAFDMTSGEFVALLDHDDVLAPNALYEIVQVILQHPLCDMIYTDEDKVDMQLKEHFQPHLKPDYNLDLLRSNNYICHFLIVRRSLFENVGKFHVDMEGAQDYDFILRCVEDARQVIHIPEILYHWRTHRESTADNPTSKMYAYEAGKRAIREHLKRSNVEGEVLDTLDFGFYRVHYPVRGKPLVTIIIPNKDEKKTLKACIDSIFEKSLYQNFEILIIENNSTTEEIFAYYAELEKNPRIRVIRWEREFNYSAINNFGVSHANGQFLLFLNNDITVISPDWIDEMLGVCQRQEVGAVGVKLLYPDNRIQHAGIVVGMGGIAGAMFVDMPGERSGYFHKASIMQDMSAVTAACMMMKRDIFVKVVEGFTEKLAVAFNDVDLCLRLCKAGYLVVYDPYVQLYHHESKTRGAEDTEEKVRRFQREIEYMRSNWIDILKNGDPYYNKNLSLSRWNYSLRPIPGMEKKKG